MFDDLFEIVEKPIMHEIKMTVNLSELTKPGKEPNGDIQNVIRAISYRGYLEAKLSTNKKQVHYDRIDRSKLAGISIVKMVVKAPDKTIYLLKGHLQISWHHLRGGEFRVLSAIKQEEIDFQKIGGVLCSVEFDDRNVSTIEEMHDILQSINDDKDFEFNLSQFSEFMEIFKYYKDLAFKLNNQKSYEVEEGRETYYFLPVENKRVDTKNKKEILDNDNIIRGYKFAEYEYENLKREFKSDLIKVKDITIKNKKNDIVKIIKHITKYKENLFLSDAKMLENAKEAKHLTLISQSKTDNGVRLIVSENMLSPSVLRSIKSNDTENIESKNSGGKYINIYDMGQKIKIESIENSLRLINQGDTGNASLLLKYLIGGEEIPTVKLEKITGTKKEYVARLNESQKKAFQVATSGSPIALIKGPPGTGKTQVITEIVQYITKELKEKVVISSQTHVAIDNVLDKLMSGKDIIIPKRITSRKNKYSLENIDTTLYETWAKEFIENIKKDSGDEISKKIAKDLIKFKGKERLAYSEMNDEDFSVVGVTTTSTQLGGKKGQEVLKGYQWLIIDEVSKCTLPEVLRYLPYVSNIIMVGDDYQLSPILDIDENDVKQLDIYDKEKFEKLTRVYEESVFSNVLEKARRANLLVELKENYRSVKSILNLYNVFYQNKLISKRDELNIPVVKFKDDNYNKFDAYFVEVECGTEVHQEGGDSRYNVQELEAIVYMLKRIANDVSLPRDVDLAVIFPYAAQISKFQKENTGLINELRKKFKSFEYDTVDAFQGKEADIVLVSTVVTDKSQRNFLSNFRRINVSMSRARDKIFIFGNSDTLSHIKMEVNGVDPQYFFKKIIDSIEEDPRGVKVIYRGKDDNKN